MKQYADIVKDADLKGIREEIYVRAYRQGFLEAREVKEPVFNCGFRCTACDIQLLNTKLSAGGITYCSKCGNAYSTGDMWQRIQRDERKSKR